MAIVNCKECGNKISSEALTCPHCGYSYKRKIKLSRKMKILISFLAIVLLGCVISIGVLIKANEWKRVFDVRYIEYVPASETIDSNSYREYEITNLSDKTVRNVYAIIEVENYYPSFEFQDLICISLGPGQTEVYKLYWSEVENAARIEGINLFGASLDIKNIEWKK